MNLEESNPKRPTLQKDLKRVGFFTLAFGAMIGVGWVTALGSWLQQAGPFGAALAFLVGGGGMVCIALCYAELTAMMPVAGGEVAYAYRAFGVFKSFLVGWCLAFGYIAISGFEAISIGLVLSFLWPAIDRWPLYTFVGSTVYLSHLLLALICTAVITYIHLRGVKQAARLQNFLTFSFLLICTLFIGAAFIVGKPSNWQPVFASTEQGVLAGFLAVLITIPFWFVGFDTIPQAAEESANEVPARTLAKLIIASVIAATVFYVLLILGLSYAGPWQQTAAADLPAAKAILFALQSPRMMNLVLLAALIGLFTSWNGFFLAGSRVLFALGRGRIIPARFGETDQQRGTPAAAIWVVAVLTVLAPLMGRQTLISLVNVGSLFISMAFFGVSMSVLKLRRSAPNATRPFRVPGGSVIPLIAAMGSAAMIIAMLLPGSPVALSWPREILIVGCMLAVGALLWRLGAKSRVSASDSERDYLILGIAGQEKR